jgi:uncharacterized protein (DUF1810 family)
MFEAIGAPMRYHTMSAFDFARFVAAQEPLYRRVTSELRDGFKRSHWMWFIFPQIAGLGRSEMARRYALSSLDEARAYLAHPLLGQRVRECTHLVLATQNTSADEIFGYPDNVKFCSSMTLFAHAAPEETLFKDALARFFGGEEDDLTLSRIAA